MNFDIDDEQREFAQHAREFFAEGAGPLAARRLLDGEAELAPGHGLLAEYGFSSLTIPESAGGVGAETLNLALVAEQAGYQLAGPSLSTAARVAIILETRPDLLEQVATGELRVAVIDGGRSSTIPTIDATSADRFLVLDGADVVLGTGTVTPGEPIDATRGLGVVQFEGGDVVAADATASWERARLVACVIIAAEGLGAASHVVELSIGHAKTRETFGRKIGAYQSIKHRIVDDWVAVDHLRSLVWWAAWAADHAPHQLAIAAPAAKAYSAEAFERSCETLIHILGGIGFTWEHDAHLFWRRAKVDRLLLGDQTEHLIAVARASLAQQHA